MVTSFGAVSSNSGSGSPQGLCVDLARCTEVQCSKVEEKVLAAACSGDLELAPIRATLRGCLFLPPSSSVRTPSTLVEPEGAVGSMRGVPSSGPSAGPTAGSSLAVRLDRRVAAGRRREPCGQERGLERSSSVRPSHSLLHVQHRQLPEKQLSVPGSSGSSRMRTVSRLMLVQNRPCMS